MKTKSATTAATEDAAIYMCREYAKQAKAANSARTRVLNEACNSNDDNERKDKNAQADFELKKRDHAIYCFRRAYEIAKKELGELGTVLALIEIK